MRISSYCVKCGKALIAWFEVGSDMEYKHCEFKIRGKEDSICIECCEGDELIDYVLEWDSNASILNNDRFLVDYYCLLWYAERLEDGDRYFNIHEKIDIRKCYKILVEIERKYGDIVFELPQNSDMSLEDIIKKDMFEKHYNNSIAV